MRLLLIAALLVLSVPAAAATATADQSGLSHVVPYKSQMYTVTAADTDDLVFDTKAGTSGLYIPIVVTPSTATTTLNSISDGRVLGQMVEFMVTGTNTLVIPTSLSNTDFGLAGDASVVEGHSCRMIWDGTSWRLASLPGLTITRAELNLLDGITATAAEVNALDGATATAAEISLLDNQWADAVYTVNAESTDTVTVNVQFNDAAGTAMATPVAVTCYLSSDSAGLDIATTAEDIAAGTDGSVAEAVANVAIFAVSEADGDLDVVVTETAGGDVYLVCRTPAGGLDISAVLDFTA